MFIGINKILNMSLVDQSFLVTEDPENLSKHSPSRSVLGEHRGWSLVGIMCVCELNYTNIHT